MIRISALVLATSLAVPFLGAPAAEANIVRNACQSADRAGSRSLCTCIQRAADTTLSRSEQRETARIFADPHRAQVLRMSDNRRDEAFWDRYTRFADIAERNCG